MSVRTVLMSTLGFGVLLAGSGLSGCSHSSDALSTIESARARTVAQRSFTERATVVATASGAPATMTGSGSYDLDQRRGRFTLSLPQISGLPPGLSADTVVQFPVAYAKVAGLPIGPGGSERWIHIDLRSLPSLPGLDVQALKAITLLDPATPLRWLTGATGGPTLLGADAFDGTPVTHQRVTIDLARAHAKASGADAAALEIQLTTFDRTTFPLDLWIDSGGLIRRMSYSIVVRGVAGGLATHQSSTIDLSGFGAKVDAATPDPAQTIELVALLQLITA